MTTARSAIKILRRFPIFMRRTTPAEPSEPAPPLSQTIKGQHPPNLEGRDWGYGTPPAEQPLREGARQRRRMDPRGGLKTNVKLSIPHACHSERSEKTLSFAVRDSRFSHMCRAPLRFPHLSFLPPLSYPPLCKGKAVDTRVRSSKKSAQPRMLFRIFILLNQIIKNILALY